MMESHKDEKSSLSSDDGYEVYPLHALDDTKLNAHLVTITLIWNDVLDVNILHSALLKLLRKGDWKKLTGRLKRKGKNNFEIHVPKQFNEENPPITFTHNDFTDVNIADHEVGSHVPKAAPVPYSKQLSPPVDLLPLAARKDHPKTVDELVDQNLPIMSFHFTSFKDATVIGILWPHSLMDAASQLNLVSSWALMVSGKEDTIRPVLGAKKDVLDAVDDNKGDNQKPLFEEKQMKLIRKVLFILHFVYMRFRNPLGETRMIYLPKHALTQLEREGEKGRDGRKVSTNDVLVAWATKLITSARQGGQGVTMINLLNARGRLPIVDQTNGVYLQNMAGLAFTFLTKQQVAKSTIGQLAAENRAQLMKQATEEEMTRFLRSVRSVTKKGKTPNFICGNSTRSWPLFCNSLASASPPKAGNFEAAMIRPGDTSPDRTNPPGNGLLLLHQGVRGYVKLGESFYVVNKTLGGGMWMMATVSKRAWVKFDAEFERLKNGMAAIAEEERLEAEKQQAEKQEPEKQEPEKEETQEKQEA